MALEPEPFLSAPVVTPPPLGSLTENQLGGLDYCGPGEYTTEGITKLCEALMSSAVTSLECAATPSEPVTFAFVSAPVDTTPPLHSTTQPVGKQPRSRRRSRSRGGSQGQLDAAIAQVSRTWPSRTSSQVFAFVSAPLNTLAFSPLHSLSLV